MKLAFSLSSFLVLATVLACAAADDLATLKATLLSLCNANGNGAFGTCCLANNNGQDITAIKNLPSCFGETTAIGGLIQKLFV